MTAWKGLSAWAVRHHSRLAAGAGGFLLLGTGSLDDHLLARVPESSVNPPAAARQNPREEVIQISVPSLIPGDPVLQAPVGPRVCILDKHPGGSGAALYELTFGRHKGNDLKMAHVKVLFSVGFILTQRKVSYNNLLYFLPREKRTYSVTFICLGNISL